MELRLHMQEEHSPWIKGNLVIQRNGSQTRQDKLHVQMIFSKLVSLIHYKEYGYKHIRINDIT